MRKILTVALMVTLFAYASPAAEKQKFVEGVYSIEVPDGWQPRVDPNQLAVSLVNAENKIARMIIATPYVNAKGDVLAVAERNLDMMYMFFGDDMNVLEEIESANIGGKNGHSLTYTAVFGEMEFHGRVFTFAHGDYVILTIGIALEKDYEQFEPVFTKMIESYAIDADTLGKSADNLRKLADAADAQYEQMMDEFEAADEDDAEEGE